jgi:hypothetical protein
VPLCAIQVKPEGLPKTVPETAKALLEQTEQTPQLGQNYLQATANILRKAPGDNDQWRQLSLTLLPKVELDLLTRLMHQRQPNRNHWGGLFDVIDYDLGTSCHYKGVLLISAILSVIAVGNLGIEAFINLENGWIIGAFSFSCIVVLVFWLALWQGIEESWEPVSWRGIGGSVGG